MSRIGSMPIILPQGVKITVEPDRVGVTGPKGELFINLPKEIKVTQKENILHVENRSQKSRTSAQHGLIRAILNNHVKGVSEGWNKVLELVGVGFRASLSGSDLVLNVGYSHPVTIKPPMGISFSINEGKIIVSGIDKHLVGQISADIRFVKEPEPYKGKGIRYEGEYIRKKAGKAAKAVGVVGK